MENNRLANIDSPTTDDRLGFSVYAAGIARTIRDAALRNQLPLTIGIYGRWGSGKTSLMKMVETELDRSSQPIPQTQVKRDSAELLVPFLWRLQGLYSILILAALVLAPRLGSWWSLRLNTKPEIATIGWLFASFVAFGGLTRAFFATWWHGRVENDLDTLGLVRIASATPASFAAGGMLFLALNYTPGALSLITGSYLSLSMLYVAGCVLGMFPREVVRFPLQAWRTLRGGNSPGSLASDPSAEVPQFQIIWFNAWKYADEKELWAALLQRLLSELKIHAVGGKRVRIKWELWKRSIEWKSGALDIARKLLPTAGKALAALAAGLAGSWLARLAVPNSASMQVTHAAATATGVLSMLAVAGAWLRANVSTPLADMDFEKYRKKASYSDHVAFLTEFSEELKDITTIARGAGNPIVLMLDDLDRCLPEEAVSVLEAIKLFVGDETPVAFVVGADREFIERAIDVMYASLKDKDDPSPRKERFSQLGHEYLEKVVQLPFNLPPIEVDRIDRFIDDRFAEDTLVRDNSQIFAAGLLANPRQVVRAVGTFSFVARLADEKGDLYAKRVVPAILAKLVVLQYRWPELYAELLEMPGLLAGLENYYKAVGDPTLLPSELAAAIQLHRSKSGLRAMLTLPPTVVGADLSPYLFITARAQDPNAPPVTAAGSGPTAASVPAVSAPIAKAAAAPTGSTTVPSAKNAAPPMPAAPPPLKAPDEDLKRFDGLLDNLGKSGADSALISRLFENKSRIESYLASNSIELAQKLLSESLTSAQNELQRLRNAAPADASVIEAEVSKDGVLQFQRAITYNPLEVQISETSEAGSQIHYAVFERNRQTASGIVQNHVLTQWQKAAAAYEEGTTSDADLISLGEGLSQVLPLLSSVFNFRLTRRLHLISAAPAMDALPWELLLLGQERQHLGINPRHSVVRGCPDQPLPSGVIKFPMPIVIAGFAGNSFSANEVQNKLNTLNGAFRLLMDTDSVRTVLLDGPNPGQFFDTLAKEAPQVVHIISPDDFPQFRLGDFGKTLKEAGVRVFILEVPNSRQTARALAKYVPAVVGMQGLYRKLGDATFAIAFHRALLRTGQADFAITEARRALYSALPPQATGFSLGFPSIGLPGDPNRALAPVLYQAAGSGLIFEPAATTTSKPQSKSA